MNIFKKIIHVITPFFLLVSCSNNDSSSNNSNYSSNPISSISSTEEESSSLPQVSYNVTLKYDNGQEDKII